MTSHTQPPKKQYTLKGYYKKIMEIDNHLPKKLGEKWVLAQREVESSYLFDFSSHPWETPCVGKSQYKTIVGHTINNPTEEHYKNRYLALMAKTDVFFEQRYTDATHNTCNAWGVIVMAVLRGTYKSMGSLQQNDLVSQGYLLGEELGICGNIKGSSRSTLIRSLKERSEEILDGKKNQYRPFQSCTPNDTTNVKKLYYARVNLQAVFCAKFVFSEANQVASDIFHQAAGWQDKKAYWCDGLNHQYEIIDVCLKQLASFYSNKRTRFPKNS